MLAFFEGGPLDGKSDYDVADDLREIVSLEYSPPMVITEATDPTAVLPVIEHVYRRENHVGVAGRFVYQGERKR